MAYQLSSFRHFPSAFAIVAASALAFTGLMASATFVGSLLTLATVGVFNAVVWYARLHFRLLKPAMEQA